MKASLKQAAIETRPDGEITVWFDYNGVDRPRTSGVSCGTNRKLAERLKRAAEAGAAVDNPAEILTDNAGKTFASAKIRVRGRAINADLRRMGF